MLFSLATAPGERAKAMTATALNTGSTVRASERAGFRRVASRLRSNAGVDRKEAAAAASTVAEVGAAAKRLRDANRAEPVVETEASYWQGELNGEDVIIFNVNMPEVIFLDAQVELRDAAARADRDQRQSALALRAARVIATIDDVKREARIGARS